MKPNRVDLPIEKHNIHIFTGVLHNLTYPASIAFAAHLTGPEEIGVISTGYLTMTYLSMLASQAVFQPMYIATQVRRVFLTQYQIYRNPRHGSAGSSSW